MHSQAYHNRINQRYFDPDSEAWHKRAEFMGASLDEKLGTVGADAWEEHEFPTGAPNWKALAVAMSEKLVELNAIANADPAAFTRMDRSEQTHPGVN